MLSDIENVRKLTRLLGDEGFVDALTNAEELVDDIDERLERVEQIEGEAEQAVQEANEALTAVDRRLQKFDEAIRLIEAKIEAGFSAGFMFFALQQWQAGSLFLALALFVMGLLGSSSLLVTIINMPQVQRLMQMSQYLADRFDDEPGDRRREVSIRTAERRDRDDTERESDSDADPRIEWQTTSSGGRPNRDGSSNEGRNGASEVSQNGASEESRDRSGGRS